MLPAPQRGLASGPVIPASVATLAELSTVPTTGLPEGFPVWVVSLQQEARLRTSLAVLVPNQIVASTNPAMRWFMQAYAPGEANPWLTSVNWFFNSATGSNENAGTSAGAPLQTLAEWVRRMAGNTLTLNYHLTFAAPEANPVLDVSLSGAGQVWLDFTPTTAVAATVNAYTAPNDVAEYGYLTLVEAVNLALYVNHRIRFTSGPANGCVAMIEVVNPTGGGANTARISQPVLLAGAAGVVPQGAILAPVNLNTLVIEALADCGAPSIHATKLDVPDTSVRSVIVSGLACTQATVNPCQQVSIESTPGALSAFYGCNLRTGMVYGNGYLVGCKTRNDGIPTTLIGNGKDDYIQGIAATSASLVSHACVHDGGLDCSNLLIVDALIDGGDGMTIIGGNVEFAGVHNMVCDVLLLSVIKVLAPNGGPIRLRKSAGSLYGTNNIAAANYGYWCTVPGVMFRVNALPTVTCTGAGSTDTRICGVNNLWAAYPVVATPQLSGVAVDVP